MEDPGMYLVLAFIDCRWLAWREVGVMDSGGVNGLLVSRPEL